MSISHNIYKILLLLLVLCCSIYLNNLVYMSQTENNVNGVGWSVHHVSPRHKTSFVNLFANSLTHEANLSVLIWNLSKNISVYCLLPFLMNFQSHCNEYCKHFFYNGLSKIHLSFPNCVYLMCHVNFFLKIILYVSLFHYLIYFN